MTQTTVKSITAEQIEELGRLADQADNVAAASQIPMRAEIHIEGMRGGLVAIRDALQKLYVEITGENPWEDWYT